MLTHTEHLQELSVFECTVERFQLTNPGVEVLQARVLRLDSVNNTVLLSGMWLFYPPYFFR